MKGRKKKLQSVLAWLLASVMMGGMLNMSAATTYAATDNGTLQKSSTNAVKWIDRIVVSDDIRAIYSTLEEGSDNDGNSDILIEDQYFSKENHSITVATETVTLSKNADKEALTAEVEAAMNAVFEKYQAPVYAVLSAFDRDHPEVFWLSGEWGIEVSVSYNNTECHVTVLIPLKTSDNDVRATDYRSQAAIKKAITQRDSLISAYLAAAKKEASTVYEILAYFNEELTLRNEYNTSGNLNSIGHDCRECVSALNGRTGTSGPVCEGYARAFKVLCDKAGIPCVLVDGNAYNGSSKEAHMWNYVQVDGKWYAVDVTWNDPVGVKSGKVSGLESADWLLVGANTVVNAGGDWSMAFKSSHPVSNTVLGGSYAHAFTNGPVLESDLYVVPTATPTVTPTPEPTSEPTAKPTPTAEPKPTPTVTPKPTATPTAEPTATPTTEPTVTPTATPTAEPTVTPTTEPTATPTVTSTTEPTVTPTVTPTAEPTVTPTATPEVTPTPENPPSDTVEEPANNGIGSYLILIVVAVIVVIIGIGLVMKKFWKR